MSIVYLCTQWDNMIGTVTQLRVYAFSSHPALFAHSTSKTIIKHLLIQLLCTKHHTVKGLNPQPKNNVTLSGIWKEFTTHFSVYGGKSLMFVTSEY